MRAETFERSKLYPRHVVFEVHTYRVYRIVESMNKETSAMNQRVNVSLPEETLRLIDRVATRGERSRFIDNAVRHYADAIGRANLRKQLKEGAVRRATRDLGLVQEWYALEEETWQGNQR